MGRCSRQRKLQVQRPTEQENMVTGNNWKKFGMAVV